MLGIGVALAGLAALTHTAIDVTRKHASSVLGIPSDGLVTVPALLDAVISVAAVGYTGHYKGLAGMKHARVFYATTIVSSLLLLASRYLYQRALQLSPLSLTIPYLAFTPAILIATAYIFLGELPTPSGLIGVCIVTLGGYLLNLKGGSPAGSAAAASKAAGDSSLLDGSDRDWDRSHVGRCASTGDVESTAGLMLPAAGSGSGSGGIGGGGPSGSSLGKRGGKSWRRVRHAADMIRQGAGFGWHQEPGVLLMIGVAVIWSVTASLDKLGVVTGPSIWAYFAVQRATIGLASLAYVLTKAPRLLVLLRDHFGVLLAISCLELAAVVLFLLAVRHLLVSYVVAIKRCNVLFSVLIGSLLFRESVASRMPYIFLMMLGMMLIVLEPSVHPIVHSHNRRD